MDAYVLVTTVTVLSVVYLLWIYLHAILDSTELLKSGGMTLSNATDDPDRQLMVLLIVILGAFAWTTLLYETGKFRTSQAVNWFGLLTISLLVCTLLTRISFAPNTHYFLAGCLAISIVGFSVSLATNSAYKYVSFAIVAMLGIVFTPVILYRIRHTGKDILSDRMVAGVELLSFISLAVLIYLFFIN
jgi:hypothetical protein